MLQEQTTLPVGSIVRGRNHGRYVIEALLGRGGFSAVYLVRDRQAPQNVYALKEIVNPDLHEQRHLAFEADILMRLKHRSLPRVYQIFEHAKLKRIYLLMDYIAGQDLETLVQMQPGQRFSLGLALALLEPIVDAVCYLHSQDPPVVHRDIKPGNIVVPTNADVTYLVDFGLAKEYVRDKTTSIFRYGSPGYAAPEQYGQGTSPRTDIYGLAATLYTLLTGTVPADALTRSTEKRGHDPLTPLDLISPTVPEAIARVVTRAMSLDSEDRQASVEEFWNELNTAAIGQGYSGRSPQVLADIKTMQLQVRQEEQKTTVSHLSRLPKHIDVGRIAMLAGFAMLLIATTSTIAVYALGMRHTPSPRPTITVTQHALSTPSPTPTPKPIPTVSIYPPLVSAYGGTIGDIMTNQKSSFYLTNIKQDQNHISGKFSGLQMTGPFTGTVTKDRTLHFVVDIGGGQTLVFDGTIKVGGDIEGSFYVSANGQKTGESGICYAQPLQ